MMRIVAGGVVLIVLVEILFVAGPAREWLFAASALVLALVLVALRARIGEDGGHAPGRSMPDTTPDESLQRWRERTRMQLAWADGTRGDWDRHLRPMLARDFQLALGRTFDTTDRSGAGSMDTAGLMMFGEQLWHWVNPSDIAARDRDRPGPGRDVLEEILTRLEQM